MLTSGVVFFVIELIGYRGSPLRQNFIIKKYPLVSFHFSFPISENYVKYSNTFTLCVIQVIYKKISF